MSSLCVDHHHSHRVPSFSSDGKLRQTFSRRRNFCDEKKSDLNHTLFKERPQLHGGVVWMSRDGILAMFASNPRQHNAHFNFSSNALPHLDCVKRNCFRTTFSWTILRSNFHISPGLEKFCTDSVHSLWCSRCTLSGLRHSHLRRLCLALKQLLTE